MSTEFLIKIAGIFLGVLARARLAWLRKLRDGEVRGFDRRYFVSALASFFIGVILTIVVFPEFKTEAAGHSFESLFKLFSLGFGFGFGWNALVLEGQAWAGALTSGKHSRNPETKIK